LIIKKTGSAAQLFLEKSYSTLKSEVGNAARNTCGRVRKSRHDYDSFDLTQHWRCAHERDGTSSI